MRQLPPITCAKGLQSVPNPVDVRRALAGANDILDDRPALGVEVQCRFADVVE